MRRVLAGGRWVEFAAGEFQIHTRLGGRHSSRWNSTVSGDGLWCHRSACSILPLPPYPGWYSPGSMRVVTAIRFQALMAVIAQISWASSSSPNCADAAS